MYTRWGCCCTVHPQRGTFLMFPQILPVEEVLSKPLSGWLDRLCAMEVALGILCAMEVALGIFIVCHGGGIGPFYPGFYVALSLCTT